MYTFTTEWEVAKCTACQFTMHKVASIHNKDTYFFSTECRKMAVPFERIM